MQPDPRTPAARPPSVLCLAVLAVALFASSCGQGETQAGETPADAASSEARETDSHVDDLRAALERLDASTAAGRQQIYDTLRVEYQDLRARIEGMAQDARVKALEGRDQVLRELVAQCDDLERRLDSLEESGGEQWSRVRAEALAEAERLKLECERWLGQERQETAEER